MEWSSLSISSTFAGLVIKQDSNVSPRRSTSTIFCFLASSSFACLETSPVVASDLCKGFLGLAATAYEVKRRAVNIRVARAISKPNFQMKRIRQNGSFPTLLANAVGLFPNSPRAARGLVFLENFALAANKCSFSWSWWITWMKQDESNIIDLSSKVLGRCKFTKQESFQHLKFFATAFK